MNIETIKDTIVNVVTRIQGCKAVHLACETEIIKLDLGDRNLPDLVEELIEEGRLVEVEYILPNLSFRLKGFLLPPGTSIPRIRNAAPARQREGSNL